MEFRVKWEIDLDANSYREAAEQALEIQRSISDAVLFTVTDAFGEKEIDLSIEEEREAV
jgi:hypothetical protein